MPKREQGQIFNYPVADVENPQGRNNLGSMGMYYWRNLYKLDYVQTYQGGRPLITDDDSSTDVFTSVYSEDDQIPKPLDTWYDKNLFGRIDRDQNTIILKENRLKALRIAYQPNQYAADFVVDAFDRFVAHMDNARDTGRLDPTGNPAIIKMSGRAAYTSPVTKYNEFQQTLVGAYIDEFTEAQQQRVTDFASFVKDYLWYIKRVAPNRGFTKGNYLLSNTVSPLISGLSIAISKADASRDGPKAAGFLRDPNFSFYVRAAKKFGFIVNKNMPWVLTADLFSPAATIYFIPYSTVTGADVTEKNFFDTYYRPCYMNDILDIYYTLTYAYEQTRRAWPFYQTRQELCAGDIHTRTKVQTMQRPIATQEIADATLTPYHLINIYIDMRQIESHNSVKNIESVKRRAYELYKYRPNSQLTGYETVGKYVNSIFREYVYPVSYESLVYPSSIKLDVKKTGAPKDTGVSALLSVDNVKPVAYNSGDY